MTSTGGSEKRFFTTMPNHRFNGTNPFTSDYGGSMTRGEQCVVAQEGMCAAGAVVHKFRMSVRLCR